MSTSEFNQDRFIRAVDVRQRYAISNATLHRWIKSGKLPKPQYLNSQRVWHQSAIEAAEENMLACEERMDNHMGAIQ